MAIELDRLQKPLRKLRKSLKNLSKDPPPEAVHKLRTRARQIESIAPALTPSEEKKTRRLLKSIKPVRKAAGGVRDMDVLTGNALKLPQNSHSASDAASLGRLIALLETMRQESADALLDTVSEKRKPARHLLKQYSRLVEASFNGKHNGNGKRNGKSNGNEKESGRQSASSGRPVQAAIHGLTSELGGWPALDEENIHPFRLKVKELRSILQLFPKSDHRLVAALGKVKDQIGEWHDWQQLAGFARHALDRDIDRPLLEQIDAIGAQKLKQALTAANVLRKRHLQSANLNGKSHQP
jgi:CHAD domain-containing protein